MKYRSELSKARGLGSAKEGASHWIHQRVSAVAMVILVTWLFCFGVQVYGADYAQARALLQQPLHALFAVLFIVTSLYHANLGIQVVIEDYIHNKFWHYALIVGHKLLAALAASAGVFAILSIYFKG